MEEEKRKHLWSLTGDRNSSPQLYEGFYCSLLMDAVDRDAAPERKASKRCSLKFFPSIFGSVYVWFTNSCEILTSKQAQRNETLTHIFIAFSQELTSSQVNLLISGMQTSELQRRNIIWGMFICCISRRFIFFTVILLLAQSAREAYEVFR